MQKLIHLSQTNLDGKILKPQIPNNFMTKLGYENNKIPRISFSPSIENCILGIGFNRIKDGNRIYYIHEPSDYNHLDIINNNEIVLKGLTPDALITKEAWITSDCKIKCTGKIEILNPMDKYEQVYFDGKKITKQYYWNYKHMR